MSEPKRQRCQGCDRVLPLARFDAYGFAKTQRQYKCKRCLSRKRGQEKKYSSSGNWADKTYRELKIRRGEY